MILAFAFSFFSQSSSEHGQIEELFGRSHKLKLKKQLTNIEMIAALIDLSDMSYFGYRQSIQHFFTFFNLDVALVFNNYQKPHKKLRC